MGKRKRSPLAAGNRYVYAGFSQNGFTVKWFTFAKGEGAPGVAIKWFGLRTASGFYPFKSERSFWRSWLFKHAVDAGGGQPSRANHR